jgi:aspartyl/asparaginyl beta-hydroxylase (cupin superfamily)
MPAGDQDTDAVALKEAADRALRNADPRAAAELFQRAVALAPRRVDLWLGLSASRRAIGDEPASLAAVNEALAIEPRMLPALLMKGALLEAMGLTRQAAVAHADALRLAPAAETLNEPTRRALAHARQAHDRHTADLVDRLKAAADVGGAADALARRADAFIEITAGRRRYYSQQPSQFFYPGMPTIEFYERDEFPWLEALESHFTAIRDEALAVWAEGSAGLSPYVHLGPGTPLDQWAELNNSLKWSAFHLFDDGAAIADNVRQCPETMAALKLVDRPKVPGRSPHALFSILRPHTHIPAHTGINNTRLVLHLPLIVPEGCRFRVGGEVREWREGEAFVFDDTIEHEAWNDSDLPRAVMICDVWSPRLSTEERELVVRLTAALDEFNGGAPAGEGL